MNHHYRGFASICVGSSLLLGCPGRDKGDTEGSGGSTTGGVTSPSTGTTGEDSTTDTPTTGASSSTGEAPQSACDQYSAADVADIENFCACAVEVGRYAEIEACLAANSDGEEGDCYCQIEEMDPAHAEYVACMAEAVAGYTACVAPLSCEEQIDLGPLENECFGAFLAANHVCYKLSAGAVLAEEACLDVGPPFMCKSGEPIPNLYVCDGDDDCKDMSDEADDLCQF